MANIQILTQPAQANANRTLSPAIELHQQVVAEPILYFAHAALFDAAGTAVSGVLQGDVSATGTPTDGGLNYSFANLKITAPGKYYVLVNIFDQSNGANHLGEARSNLITVV
ncbi:hypothetical protein MKX07_000393 [Trichoderma sp. CBMAI-0711]|uniref:Velvet domain-containing protein n=1 Tax=Trichoderma parareesei TaxID=858221 RepID=A0A2H2ZPB7_TRIPA|nr:hypothetical protein MKX07_000393 [Trichoderma sp. CBMAI-0711]OTA02565.1 hypothetical protein A9Z42_0029450 [Trichoderma parareesei]